MNAAGKNVSSLPLNLVFITVALFWSALIVTLAGWNYWEAHRATLSNVRSTAREAFEKDLTYRRWAAMHGGVYVPITPETPPNPYLANNPERDISTPSGKKLTLVNPAYMTRQVHELGRKTSYLRGHITSLNAIRPENAPDDWERRALQGFERDLKEVSSLETLGNETFFRIMNPLITEAGCLKCHAAQGYKVGDIRGGISVSVPWKPFGEALREQLCGIAVAYGMIWVVGILGLHLGRARLQNYLSGRNRAEEALRESALLWRLSIDNMLEAYALHEAIFDANGRMVDYRFLEFNPAAQKMTNVAREEIVGRTAMALYPHVVERGLMDRYADVMATGVPAVIEDFYYAGDNLDKAFDISCFRIDDRHFVCVFRDITDQKRAEEEKRLAQKAAERLTEEVSIIAEVGRVIGSTLYIEEVYDRFADETRKLIPFDSLIVNLKKPLDDALEIAYTSGVEIKDRKKGDSFPLQGSVSEAVMFAGKGVIVQSQNIWKNRGRFSTLGINFQAGLNSMMSVPLISRNSVIGILVFRSKQQNAYTECDLNLAERIGMQISGAIANAALHVNLRDITSELRESEGKFRLLVEHSPDPISVLTRDCFVYANPAAVRLFGAESDQQLLGAPLLDRIHPDYRERVRGRLSLLNVERKSVGAMEQKYLRLDGSVVDVEASAVPVMYNGKNAFLSLVRDITERKQMELQAARTEKLEAIGTLAAGIAHDFNNLLGAMFGYLELSKEEAERAHQKSIAGYLSKAFDSFEKAKGLTEQLLTFTKGGAPARTTQALTDLLRKAVSLSVSGSNVMPLFTIPEGIWLCSIDENQISQVIDSIIINARHAMLEGGNINISLANLPSDDVPENYPRRDYVRISIRDYGTGIAPEHLPRVFDPFFSTKKMGSGLGLAASYSIIRQHDGFIEVESQVGKGATFHIYLPASQERLPVAAKQESQNRHHGKGKILIMDDEDLICSALGLMLNGMGYSVITTKNGRETAEAVMDAINAGEPFAAAILDLTIPGGPGGREIIGDLLKLDPNMKAIASSGYSDNPVISRPSDYGFAASLKKPYRKHDLSVALDTVFAKKQPPP